jgi:hypothetical protein
MPTDEWFKENPKVSAYIPQTLNEKLTDWMKGRSIKKVSQALTTILEEYLGVVQTEPINQSHRDDRLEVLELRFDSLFQTVQELREAIQASSRRVVQTELFSVEPTEETWSEKEMIALIDAESTIEVVEEEIPDDEPDEILFEFLQTEKQATNPDTQKEAIEVTELDQTEESSPRVEESSPIAEIQESEGFKPIMTNKEASQFLNEPENTIRSRYRRKDFIGKGHRFTAIKEGKNPRWKVEKLEDKF